MLLLVVCCRCYCYCSCFCSSYCCCCCSANTCFLFGCFGFVFACLCSVWLKLPNSAIFLQFQTFFPFSLPKPLSSKSFFCYPFCFSFLFFFSSFLFLLFLFLFFFFFFFFFFYYFLLLLFLLFLLLVLIIIILIFLIFSSSLPFPSFIFSLSLVLCQSLFKQFFLGLAQSFFLLLALMFVLFSSGFFSSCLKTKEVMSCNTRFYCLYESLLFTNVKRSSFLLSLLLAISLGPNPSLFSWFVFFCTFWRPPHLALNHPFFSLCFLLKKKRTCFPIKAGHFACFLSVSLGCSLALFHPPPLFTLSLSISVCLLSFFLPSFFKKKETQSQQNTRDRKTG